MDHASAFRANGVSEDLDERIAVRAALRPDADTQWWSKHRTIKHPPRISIADAWFDTRAALARQAVHRDLPGFRSASVCQGVP
jgi:hypothetical protein